MRETENENKIAIRRRCHARREMVAERMRRDRDAMLPPLPCRFAAEEGCTPLPTPAAIHILLHFTNISLLFLSYEIEKFFIFSHFSRRALFSLFRLLHPFPPVEADVNTNTYNNRHAAAARRRRLPFFSRYIIIFTPEPMPSLGR